MPRLHVDDNPHLVSPGVKWGVQPSSFTHCTEFFGPVLGVMEARDLDDAIDLVNATGYGLTSGLESLDDREQELWAAASAPATSTSIARRPARSCCGNRSAAWARAASAPASKRAGRITSCR